MKTKRKILPGQAGTKSLMEKYGDDLICVRYKYDEKDMVRIKTVELLVEKSTWIKNIKKDSKNKVIGVKIDYAEMELRAKVREAGGKWNRTKKVWELPMADIVMLNLESRIVENFE
ncbi:MAG: hypothetical protein HQK77_16175 [Desulfobacterales bacterium]|nr:hypothetical protein [Desulfobacterales bacterium]